MIKISVSNNELKKIQKSMPNLALKNLEIGDIFSHAKSSKKTPEKFTVYGNSEFNGNFGSATRKCLNQKNEIVNKSCMLDVIKHGTSLFKQKILNSK